ncbi:hypothetical protein GUJ93_ZPchr0088g33643 [Zizania palustris]|uniref:Uncharacterized protein n=1 Tax=Zizania palustris TaxID=103762 RepID=A0A8J5VE25_ZIZPA|nr:hypothetical protein GUJ93_ZPchr0088g33643 [Zizania palustris]
MDGRNASLCFLLVLLLLGNPTSASTGDCWGSTSGAPLCIGFLCKATCWVGAKIFKGTVREHKCIEGSCYCYICDKK